MKRSIANRVLELQSIGQFLDGIQQKPRFRLLVADARSGLTSFLRHCVDLRRNREISVYIDGSLQSMNAVFSQFSLQLYNFYPKIWKKFDYFQRRQTGRSLSRDIALAAVSSIPYVGSSLARSSEATSNALVVSHYPTAAAEFVCSFMAELSSEYAITLFIDDVQDLDRSSRELLRTTISRSYRNLRYIAGYVRRPGSNPKALHDFSLEMTDLGYALSVEEFSRPDDKFVAAYAEDSGVSISAKDAVVIATAAQGDIYRIRAAIAANTSEFSLGRDPEISPVGKAVLGLLIAAEQGLRESDLLSLLTTDEAVFLEDEGDYAQNVKILQELNLVNITQLPEGDRLVTPVSSQSHVREAIALAPSEIFRLQGRLFIYLNSARKWSSRHSESEIILLLFRLAKIVAPDSIPHFVNELIRVSLKMGAPSLAEEFISRATTPTEKGLTDISDYVARLAFLMSFKKYKQVLTLISRSTQEWRNLRIARVFAGIALNRCRHHHEAESELNNLCETADSKQELTLLVAYRIVGRVHDNDLPGGKLLFERYRDSLSDAENYGYFLRNGAEVLEPRFAIQTLTSAIEVFRQRNDNFGVATSLCNRGAKRAQTGDASGGLRDVEKSLEMLEIFGIQHLGLVLANVGHCHLYLLNFNEAEASIEKSLRLLRRGLPHFYAKLNLAAALALQGKAEEAVPIVDDLVMRAGEAKVDRVRQKVYPNAALIHLWNRSSPDKIRRLCELSRAYPDRRDPAITRRVINSLNELIDVDHSSDVSTFFELFSPCSLLYWYQNPLEGLPAYLLPFKADG